MNSAGFWKPGGSSETTTSSNIFRDNAIDNESSTSNVFNFHRSPLAQQRLLLPICKHRKQILYAVEEYHILIIVGETGSGKSTQIPQYLLENGWAGGSDDDDDETETSYQIVCTQPRRIAAQTLAKRVSNEVGTQLGEDVGYTVRFDDCTNRDRQRQTKIKYVTDAMLIREATVHDPLLSKYSVIMIDEAHERNINTDILLGIIKKIRLKRPSLRIIICSATINADEYLNYFIGANMQDHTKDAKTEEKGRPAKRSRWGNPADGKTYKEVDENDGDGIKNNRGTIISVDGRQYPVDVLYLKESCSNYIRQTVETAINIHNTLLKSNDMNTIDSSSSDILCFLPSSDDIDSAIQLAEETMDNYNDQQTNINSKKKKDRRLVFLPLYGNLPYKAQALVFQPKTSTEQRTTRRVVFATNIAETSVTVPDVKYVIDSGYVKLPYFDPKTGFDRLMVTPISRSSAKQRVGRAGRLSNGICYRLYTERYYTDKMINETPPEILRTNLTQFVLVIKSLGIDNILNFDLFSIPSIDSLEHGIETLYALGAIDDQTNLTTKGYSMSAFAVEPRISCMLLESIILGCSWEVCAVAAALQVRSLFLSPRTQRQKLDYDASIQDIADRSGDHVTYANLIADYDDGVLDIDECKEKFINYVALKRAVEVRDQLANFLKRFGRVKAMGLSATAPAKGGGNRHRQIHNYNYNDDNNDERSKSIRKCVTSGFFFNTAKLGNDGRYYTIRGSHKVIPHSSSILCQSSNLANFSEYIVFGETTDAASSSSSTGSIIEIKSCSTISAKWLYEIAPHYWK